jgi:hypothetical protein
LTRVIRAGTIRASPRIRRTAGGHIRSIDPEITLGGYLAKHERAPAFGGSDGSAYSVAIWVDAEPDERGRYGAALLFVRWSEAGDRAVGHVETEPLAWGRSREEASARLEALSLFDVKAALDAAILARPEGW